MSPLPFCAFCGYFQRPPCHAVVPTGEGGCALLWLFPEWHLAKITKVFSPFSLQPFLPPSLFASLGDLCESHFLIPTILLIHVQFLSLPLCALPVTP